MGEPVVSTCMTVYNQAEYLPQAILSVLSQKTSFPFELVIGEDCSTDNTLEICRKFEQNYPAEVKVVAQPKNGGFLNNLAATWENCRGKYIAMLEGDDFWCHEGKLQEQADFLETHPEYSMCFTLTGIESDNPNRHDQWPYHKNHKRKLETRDIIRRNLIANCSVMYRKNGNPFIEQPWLMRLPHCDIALHVLHSLNGPIGYIPKRMATYRLHAGSAFEHLPYTERLKRAIIIYEAMAENLSQPYADYTKEVLALMYQGLAAMELQQNLKKSLKLIWVLPAQKRISGVRLLGEEALHILKAGKIT